MSALKPNHEDVVKFLTDVLKSRRSNVACHGGDLYIQNAMLAWVQDNRIKIQSEIGVYGSCDEVITNHSGISEVFFSAAWELSRLGILRPGVRKWADAQFASASVGTLFTVTPFGERWLSESDDGNPYFSTEPGRFAEMMKPFFDLFGKAFSQRANEAIRCYGAHAYLACCAMSGAATESALVSIACMKIAEEEVEKKRRGHNGYKEVQKVICRNSGVTVDALNAYCEVIKYWRDEVSHAKETAISETHAYVALNNMLRCSMFLRDNVENLIKKTLE